MANPYFNAAYYLTNNPDLFAAGINTAEAAWNHYVQYGAAEALAGGTTRKPAPWFDAKYYLETNSDLAVIGLDPVGLFEHFANHGLKEGRAPAKGMGVTDEQLKAYAAANEDLRTAFGIENVDEITEAQYEQLAQHFYMRGYEEDRPGAPFDAGGDVDPDVGETYTLTTGLDNIQGTSGDDIVGGTDTTLQAIDIIDGGAGNDKLVLALANDYAGGAAISNIEQISATGSKAGGTSFNASGIVGLKVLENNSTGDTSLTFNNVGNIVDLSVRNTALLTTVSFTEAAVAGSADVVNVLLDNVTGGAASAISLNSATGNAAGVETVNIVSGGNSANSTQLNSNDTSIKTINISGAQNLSLVAGTNVTTTATTVNAADLTGNLTLTGLGVANHTLTGGSGNDTFDLSGAAGTYTASDKIDGGEGTNTLRLHNTDATGVTTKQTNVSNIQLIDVASLSGAIDVTKFGASGLKFTSSLGGNSTAVLAAGTATLDFTDENVTTGGNFTLGISNTGTATDDVLNWNVGTNAAASVNTGTGAVSLSGFETVNLVSLGDGTGNSFAGAVTLAASAGASTKLVITGDEAITFTGALTANTVDASGLAAALSMNAVNGGGVAMNITGGSKSDTIQGSTASDVIKAGGAGDTITFTQTAGSAFDTLVFEAGDSVSKAGVANGFDSSVTDTFTGIVIDAAFAAAAGSKFVLDTEVDATAVTVSNTSVTFGTTTVTNAGDFYVYYTAGNDAFVYQDTNGDKVIDAGEFAIKLVGNAADWADDAAGWTIVGGNLQFVSVA